MHWRICSGSQLVFKRDGRICLWEGFLGHTLSPTVLSTVRRVDKCHRFQIFHQRSPLYHSNPTEKLLTENTSPESTAGQWVWDGGHLSEQNPGLFSLLRSGFLQRLRRARLTRVSEACHQLPLSGCDPAPHPGAPATRSRETMVWLSQGPSPLHHVPPLSVSPAPAQIPKWLLLEPVDMVSRVRLIFWK